MDIQKASNVKPHYKRSTIVVICVIFLIVLSVWLFSQPSGSERVAQHQIWTGVVQQGDIALQVEGYGKLKSKEQRLLTTPANATVEEIFLKPGSIVTVDSVILRLSNPKISQQVKDAQRNFKHSKTAYLQLELNQQRELLSQQAQQEKLLSELELAELKVKAEENLVVKGIVSELTFKRSQLDFRQLSRRINIEKMRLKQLIEVHQKELTIAQDKIDQQIEQVAVITDQFNKLNVKAGISGVVQSLPVELGQSVALGEKVALVGSIDSLYAMLNVSQADMDLIELNQIVDIDTRGGNVSGQVQRINPLVKQGMVSIEVFITGELPKNARPDLNIDGTISTGMLTNTMFIKKPVNVSSGMKATLFKVDTEQNTANKIAITYGQESGEYIQIIAGAKPNETYILSDMSRWAQAEQITITQ